MQSSKCSFSRVISSLDCLEFSETSFLLIFDIGSNELSIFHFELGLVIVAVFILASNAIISSPSRGVTLLLT